MLNENPLDRDELAARVAADIPAGAYVNLGIGQPTRVADFLAPDSGVVLHTENGMLGMGLPATGDAIDPDLTNAGKHASGTTVNVELARLSPGELHVLVTNPIPVRPGPAPPGAGAGLVGLAERVGLLGGRLRHGVHRAPDGSLSFRLEAWLPWPV